jgi:hypothetical protein
MPYRDNAGVICVGATIADGFRWLGSNYSEHLDIVAPGSYIPTLGETPEYRYPDGTSFAAPHVSAVAGLILSVNPDLTRQQVSDIIEITARKLPDYTFSDTEGRTNGKWNQEVGYGLLNAMDAVSYAKGYYNLASFEYSGQDVSLTLTANKDIAVIWDWETEDITEIDVTSTTTQTIEHTYTTSGTRRIYIAEKIDFDTDTLSYNSTALVKFDLTTGNYASNFEFRPYNKALEYIRIIGGYNFATQTVSIADLPALKDLYLVRMPNANVTIARCPLLLRFGSSREIWRGPLIDLLFPSPLIQPGSEQPLDPDVVIDGPITQVQWPDIPESCVSYMLLSIMDCDNLQKVSLENVNIATFDFSDLTVEALPQAGVVKAEADLEKAALKVSVKVTNTGKVAGAEVVQCYVSDTECSVERPVKELKAFGKVFLEPGETKEVELFVNNRGLAFYDVESKAFVVEAGEFGFHVGNSSDQIMESAKIFLTK